MHTTFNWCHLYGSPINTCPYYIFNNILIFINKSTKHTDRQTDRFSLSIHQITVFVVVVVRQVDSNLNLKLIFIKM